MKLYLFCLIFLSTFVHAEVQYLSQTLQNWPALSLRHMFAKEPEDMIVFEETDFISLKEQALQSSEPMIATSAKKNFDDSFTKKDSQTKWRMFMGAVSGNRVSGFYQGIGMTTVLIDGELFFDAQVQHMNYNFKNRCLDERYSGDRYGYATSLHWFPTDYFSLHLGVSGLTDKQ